MKPKDSAQLKHPKSLTKSPFSVVLASQSPYKRSQLQKLGIRFEAHNPDIDEQALTGESAQDCAARLSELKAKALNLCSGNTLVIGCDQTAEIEGVIIGKPGSHENAVKQLRRSSGKTVTFYSAVSVLDTSSGVTKTRVIPTRVKFRALTEEEIQEYLMRDQAYDCAGSFKVESLGIALFEKIESEDPSALEGLPLIATTQLLREFGLNPLLIGQ